MKNTEIELGDFSAIYTTKGIELEVELVDHSDAETNGEIIANYTLLVDLELGFKNYEIINKHYAEHLTIKETKQCDERLAETYANNYFESVCVESYEEYEEWGWFI